jgi:hypothetical protein
MINCSAGFHDRFPAKFEESKESAKKMKIIHIQTVLIRLKFGNDPIQLRQAPPWRNEGRRAQGAWKIELAVPPLSHSIRLS